MHMHCSHKLSVLALMSQEIRCVQKYVHRIKNPLVMQFYTVNQEDTNDKHTKKAMDYNKPAYLPRCFDKSQR